MVCNATVGTWAYVPPPTQPTHTPPGQESVRFNTSHSPLAYLFCPFPLGFHCRCIGGWLDFRNLSGLYPLLYFPYGALFLFLFLFPFLCPSATSPIWFPQSFGFLLPYFSPLTQLNLFFLFPHFTSLLKPLNTWNNFSLYSETSFRYFLGSSVNIFIPVFSIASFFPLGSPASLPTIAPSLSSPNTT